MLNKILEMENAVENEPLSTYLLRIATPLGSFKWDVSSFNEYVYDLMLRLSKIKIPQY